MPSCELPARRMTASLMFSGRRSALSGPDWRSDAGAVDSVAIFVESLSGKTKKPQPVISTRFITFASAKMEVDSAALRAMLNIWQLSAA